MIDLLKTARASYQHGDIIECLCDGELCTYDSYHDTIEYSQQSNSVWLTTRGAAPNILLYENKKWAKIITRPSDKNVRARQELSTLLTRQATLLKELNIINKRIIKSYEEIN